MVKISDIKTMNIKLYKYEWFVFLLYNRERLLYLYKNKLNIIGRILEVKDALGRTATTNMYALSEKHLFTVDNIDSGKRWILNDTAGKPVKKWDSRGNEFTFNYDELQRPTETVVNGVCTEKLVYGDSSSDNNIGQVVESYAQDGKTSFEYDFKGNVVKQTKQFAEDNDTQLDWNGQVGLLGTDGTFVTETTYDALNRPKSIKQPDETILFYGYDKGGLLNTVQRNNTEVHISNIEYNEKGQRLNIYYGNNTKTRYFYNDKNFRLTRILTTRKGTQDKLQDLNYTFDAVGNIIQQTDNAQQTHYFNNSVIAPTSTYEYDALYRLTKATGRELTSLTAPNENDFANDIPLPNIASNAMQNYIHNYQYDKLGNILQDKWKSYQYNSHNNYLLGNDNIANQFTYDGHGNMTSMPHLSSMVWNEKDEMTSATNGTFVSYYNYDAQGNRTRKTVVKGNVTETRYYVGGYEVFRKEVSGALDFERTTLNINDDEKVFVRVEQKNNENEVVRYQYDNHLGSACLELDNAGAIISYEEYHPFGTTSFRSGRNEVEVSFKRYKYNGKERDEETGLYQYGMRYYAAWICRFVSCDPLQFEYPHYTPFQYAGNKPITYIDLDGAEEQKATTYQPAPIDIECKPDKIQNPVKVPPLLENFKIIDQWEVNQNGDVKKVKALKSIGIGGIDNDSDIYELFVLGDDGKRKVGADGKMVSIEVKDRNILDQLTEIKGNVEVQMNCGGDTYKTNIRSASGGSENLDDMLNLFKFASYNTNVEWRFDYGKENGETKYNVGTWGYHSGIGFFMELDKIISSIHSHPEAVGEKDENYSMGADRTNSLSRNFIEYVYMRNSGNLYNVKQGKSSYKTNIKTFEDFINFVR